MPTEFPNKKTKRRRYRTRMFDNRLSFPTTSEQVRQLQAEADAEKRSVASLVREAIDQFLPRLRDRRRKRERPPDGQSAGRTEGVLPQKPHLGDSQKTLLRLLGEPQKRTAREWRYGPPKGSLKINLENWTWYDSQTKEGGKGLVELIQREKKMISRTDAVNWLGREGLLWEKD